MSNEVPESVRFTSFNEFYPYYLGEHQNPTCRRLHVIGSTGVLVLLAFGLGVPDWRFLLAMPLCGYGFAWVGHFFFEHNRPALSLSALVADGRLGAVPGCPSTPNPFLNR